MKGSSKVQTLMRNLSVFEKALIGAAAGGIAGAFTYVCLHPLDTIETKLQTKGAAEIYKGTFDAIAKTFQTSGNYGFLQWCISRYSRLNLFICYLHRELRVWIQEKDGFLGLYASYFVTLLGNLPAGILSCEGFLAELRLFLETRSPRVFHRSFYTSSSKTQSEAWADESVDRLRTPTPIRAVSYPERPESSTKRTLVKQPEADSETATTTEPRSWTKEDIRYMKDFPPVSSVSYSSKVAPLRKTSFCFIRRSARGRRWKM
ncbi:hypothetical protein NE237_031554 [Protea cynaroides]|uniref:Uncharacterized protein n=1 Tax=Protea cynaroides TaxID=273540 RepID=A0A9Q0L1N5_9MAGN|nr:hypothetical protein NE237_031554 [Protea cynaroides]